MHNAGFEARRGSNVFTALKSAGKVQTKRQWYQLQADGSVAISNKLDAQKPDVLAGKHYPFIEHNSLKHAAFLCVGVFVYNACFSVASFE